MNNGKTHCIWLKRGLITSLFLHAKEKRKPNLPTPHDLKMQKEAKCLSTCEPRGNRKEKKAVDYIMHARIIKGYVYSLFRELLHSSCIFAIKRSLPMKILAVKEFSQIPLIILDLPS